MSSKLKGSRLESEVDRCRSECNWKRLMDLLPAIRSKNSGMENFADLIEGELILEFFVEKHGGIYLSISSISISSMSISLSHFY